MTLGGQFEAFVRTLNDAEVIDDLPSNPAHGERKADFLFANRSVVAEMKRLTRGASSELQSFWDNLARERDISVAGVADLDRLLSTQPDADALRRRALAILSRRLSADFSAASSQIRSTRSRMHLDDAPGLLILLNENNLELRPEVAIWAIANQFRRRKPDGSPIGGAIDCVWYLSFQSEHSVELDGTPHFLSATVARDRSTTSERVDAVVTGLQTRLSVYFRLPLSVSTDPYTGGRLQPTRRVSVGFRAGLFGTFRPLSLTSFGWAGRFPDRCRVCSADFHGRPTAHWIEDIRPEMRILWFECPVNGCAADIRVADLAGAEPDFAEFWRGTYADLMRDDWRSMIDRSR